MTSRVRSCNTILLTVLPIIIVSLNVVGADFKSASTITKVTVYSDQALITRNLNATVPAGVHTVIITDLPWGMMDQSLKVTGTSEIEMKISDIRTEKIFLDTIPESRMAERYQRLHLLRNEKNTLERSSHLFKSQYESVDAMKENYLRSLALQNPGQKASVEEWDKLLQFVEKKKSEYSDKMDLLRKEIEAKTQRIGVLVEEIKLVGSAAKKIQKQVSVTLNVKGSGTIRLEISYLISGASWTPSYEVRSQSTESTMQIVYSGNVQQSTGEDWNNVGLTLSTARPAISQNLPVLLRWTVDIPQVRTGSGAMMRGSRAVDAADLRPSTTEMTLRGNTLMGKVTDNSTGEPLVGASVIVAGTTFGGTTDIGGNFIIYNIPEGTHTVRASMLGYQPVLLTGVRITKTTGAEHSFYLTASGLEIGEVVIAAERARVEKNATSSIRKYEVDGLSVMPEESMSSSQITSSTFSIPTRQTIPGDKQSHKVGIAVEEIPVMFSYTVVPKQITTAFLEAKGKNPRSYPLLAGEASIFLNNAYVATIWLKTIMPNDSFSVNLGADEAIRVERKLVNRFAERTGTFTSKNTVTLEYENQVENFKSYPVEIVLQDQIPVSANDKVTVEVTDPDPKIMRANSDGIYIWKLLLQPNEKRSVKLKFSVEYPPEFVLYGIGK